MRRLTKKLLALTMVLVFLLQTTAVGAAQTSPVPQTLNASLAPASASSP